MLLANNLCFFVVLDNDQTGKWKNMAHLITIPTQFSTQLPTQFSPFAKKLGRLRSDGHFVSYFER
jgi:hypothetical protein